MLASQCWQHQSSFKGSTKDLGTRKPTSARHNTSMSRKMTVKELEQRLATLQPRMKERDSRFASLRGAPQVSCAKPRPASSLLGAVLCENRPAHSNKMWGAVGDGEVATRLRRMGSESPPRLASTRSSLGASPACSPGVSATARGKWLKPEAPSDQCNLITPEMPPSPATTLSRTGKEMLQEELSKVSYYSPAMRHSSSSMMQPALHPSPVTVLPSSQASLDAFDPSPQASSTASPSMSRRASLTGGGALTLSIGAFSAMRECNATIRRGSLDGGDALGIGAFNAMRKAGVSTSSASLPTTITKSTVAGSLKTIGLNTTVNIVRGSNTATVYDVIFENIVAGYYDPEFNNCTAIASGTATPSSARSRRSSISLQQVETHSESEASVSTTTSFSVFQPAPPCSSGASSNTSTMRSERRTHDAKKWWVERVASEAHVTRKREERVLEQGW